MRIRPSPPKYDDEYFKFIKNNFGKPMRDGFEDIFQCQANLQEGMRSQKQLQNLELRIDNKDLRHQAQLDIIEVDISLKTQNRALNTLIKRASSQTNR
ncbi:hypothetical protein E5676_scaffold313G00130 [Cucumis melo var. makuwa]|uniref:Uncharacterized protein n=1 Tax=Cucumis melo var. makuwa TaxID=1194695 RepID=A0A5D3DS12_CUCMM|nr:hypothetical protein E5676_scaffold313G00130 [Cucumis melo var. makuwa]